MAVMADNDTTVAAGAICGFMNLIAGIGADQNCRHSTWMKRWILQRPVRCA